MRHGFRHRRGLGPIAASALTAIAMLAAFASPASAHHHGSDDSGSGDPAGTIASFDADSGVLTIDLAKGGSISALVTDETRIETGGDCDRDRRGRHAGPALRRHFGGDHHSLHGGWHHGHEGGSEDLVPGAVVDDAVLVLEDGSAVFAKVELGSPHSG
ncbi:MAG: hypothetical protein ACOYD4_13535 [Solirubrobacterales bacterium]